jgi:hypothetical protein
MNRHAVLPALTSAALFGVSTPAAKVLLGRIDRRLHRLGPHRVENVLGLRFA